MPSFIYGHDFDTEVTDRVFSLHSVYNWGKFATFGFYDALYADMKKNIGAHATNRKANINGEICFAYRFDPYWVFYADECGKRVIKYFRHEKENTEWIE